jgi:hypothetical protein
MPAPILWSQPDAGVEKYVRILPSVVFEELDGLEVVVELDAASNDDPGDGLWRTQFPTRKSGRHASLDAAKDFVAREIEYIRAHSDDWQQLGDFHFRRALPPQSIKEAARAPQFAHLVCTGAKGAGGGAWQVTLPPSNSALATRCSRYDTYEDAKAMVDEHVDHLNSLSSSKLLADAGLSADAWEPVVTTPKRYPRTGKDLIRLASKTTDELQLVYSDGCWTVEGPDVGGKAARVHHDARSALKACEAVFLAKRRSAVIGACRSVRKAMPLLEDDKAIIDYKSRLVVETPSGATFSLSATADGFSVRRHESTLDLLLPVESAPGVRLSEDAQTIESALNALVEAAGREFPEPRSFFGVAI